MLSLLVSWLNNTVIFTTSSRCSKRFRFVLEQRKTSILAAREMKQVPKNERGGRGREKKEGF